MRIPIILLLMILAMAACASPQPAAPIIPVLPNPIRTAAPVPVQPTSTDVPTGVSAGVPSEPTVAPCECPTGSSSPAQAPAGASDSPTVICNCPNIPVSPPLPGPQAGSTPQGVPTNGIVLEDNGKTFILHPGETILLNLGTDVFNWTVNIDDQNVVTLVRGVMVIRGAQGIYQAGAPGQAVLTAVGTPLCQNTGQVCNALVILFEIKLIVQ